MEGLTVKMASQRAKASRSAVEVWIKRGWLKTIPTDGGKRKYLIDRESLQRLVANGYKPEPEEFAIVRQQFDKLRDLILKSVEAGRAISFLIKKDRSIADQFVGYLKAQRRCLDDAKELRAGAGELMLTIKPLPLSVAELKAMRRRLDQIIFSLEASVRETEDFFFEAVKKGIAIDTANKKILEIVSRAGLDQYAKMAEPLNVEVMEL